MLPIGTQSAPGIHTARPPKMSPLCSDTLGGLTAVGDDPDHDGLPNAIENILGTTPDVSNPGLTIAPTTITDTTAPANDLVEVTATLTGTPEPQIFVRLNATQL